MPIDTSLPLHRSCRVNVPANFYGFYVTVGDDIFSSDRILVNLDEQASYKEAMVVLEAAKYIEALDSKIQSMYDN